MKHLERSYATYGTVRLLRRNVFAAVHCGVAIPGSLTILTTSPLRKQKKECARFALFQSGLLDADRVRVADDTYSCEQGPSKRGLQKPSTLASNVQM